MIQHIRNGIKTYNLRVFIMIITGFFGSFLIAKDQYTINMMWLNKTMQSDQIDIFPVVDRNDSDIIGKARGWAERNPDAKLNFWYDGQTVTPQQLAHTRQLINMLKAYSENQKTRIAQITLLDIRGFLNQFYANTAEVFAVNIPIYFRVDLLRLMVSLQDVRSCSGICFSVYTDVDVTPMGEQELFTDEVKNGLATKGLVLKEESGWFENSFHILSNQQPMMIKALQEAGVNVNIERTKLFLKNNPGFKNFFDPQYVYTPTLSAVFIYFYHLTGAINLTVLDAQSNAYVPLERNKDNSNRFFPDFYGADMNYLRRLKIEMPTNGQGNKIDGIEFQSTYLRSRAQKTYSIPTIRVVAPPIKYNYNN